MFPLQLAPVAALAAARRLRLFLHAQLHPPGARSGVMMPSL